MSEKRVEKMTGYKATDANMCCRGFQFTMGEWFEHDGEIVMCESGFHFCEYPSGPWSYYSNEGTRVFKIEAEGVLLGEGPGSDLKHVSRRIRFVEELFPDGNRNTGDGNTGYGNTGDRNTGYGNTGDGNTGDRNTGYGNTGYGNTGYGNVGNYHTGDLCCKPSPYLLFDLPADRESAPRELIRDLAYEMTSDEPFDYSRYLGIPNATLERIKALHDAHIAARREMGK